MILNFKNPIRRFIRGLVLKWRLEVRYIIEKKIFPKIKHKRVLLVGVEYYTENYPNLLKTSDLCTLDINPSVAKFGAKNHIVGDVSEVDKFFPEESFDVVLLLGIFGYGLNDMKGAEKTLENCSKILKKNGLLILNWSDIVGKNPIKPRSLKNFSLFSPISFNGYSSAYRTRQNHIFEFLIKK